ncbi:MAG: GDP-mannose 4,6-dehydratase [Flammeovirgaceae bacterium]|nr:GDP-mannose 4,6-dehydratase [Flammeovirgaceae bacterium]|tara:strand:- start:1066 stop:2046 length:981 start_codon:yes stop_codon:yes gene_type:complete
MAKKALITGVCGQDGAYLSKLLLSKDYSVHGMVRDASSADFWRLNELDLKDQIIIEEADMRDEDSLNTLVENIKPDEIYNLAALSFVGASWDTSVETSDINAMGALRLLNAMKEHSPKAKYYQASTSEMYGNSNGETFQDETTPLHPRSPYAISKLFAHWMTINYRESYGLYACSGILFNHESPLRGINFVTRKITDGVARIKLGLEDSITLGNIDAQRDWGFAGDYVKAMWEMLQQDTPEDFVISTGETHSVRDFLQAAFKEIAITDWESYVQFDDRFTRPLDVETLCGSNNKAQQKLHWEPTVSFEELVRIMVEWDLKRLTSAS